MSVTIYESKQRNYPQDLIILASALKQPPVSSIIVITAACPGYPETG